MKLILNVCIVFSFIVGSLNAVKFRCDYSYSNVGWLKYHVIPATWRDARLRCQYEGAMLASPTSIELKAAMMNTIRDVDIFTGIHSTITQGCYYSVDGTPLDKIPHGWAAKEPDNKNNAESCIAMDSEGKLSDVNCDTPRPYMCYRAKSLVDANICGTTDPEYHFESRANKCYKFHTTPRNFKRAHFICSAEGGHLAIINSVAESQVIRDVYAQYPSNTMIGNFYKDTAFIGFYNWGESIEWKTIHGQSLAEAGFNSFHHGQPDNAGGSEYCGSVFRSGLINDANCETTYPFICEKQPDYPALCHTEDFDEEHTKKNE